MVIKYLWALYIQRKQVNCWGEDALYMNNHCIELPASLKAAARGILGFF